MYPNPALGNIEWEGLLKLQLQRKGRDKVTSNALQRGLQTASSWGLEKRCMGGGTLSGS